MDPVLEAARFEDADLERRRRRWKLDPVAYVRERFHIEPDKWQREALEMFPRVKRLCLKACKGPGKTALLAWLIWCFLETRPNPQIAATSITEDNLSSGVWRELAKWRGCSPELQELYEWTSTAVFKRTAPATWRAEARTWPKQADPARQAATLAGIHDDNSLFVLDEVGGIPQGVVATAEAVLATGVDCKVVIAGNPERTDGPLYRACTLERGLWHVIEVTGDPDDPDRSPRIDLEWARGEITRYGRDNPWVMVNVLGKFPAASINALLGPDEVVAAQRREVSPDRYVAIRRRIGVDVARYGDDRTVLFPRQGRMARFAPVVMRHARGDHVSVIVANRVMLGAQNFAALKPEQPSPDIFIDATGGWGAGTWDNIPAEWHAHAVQFGGEPADPRFYNARAEMWWRMAEWVKSGGALPELPELVTELTAVTFSYKDGKLLLEDKDQVKKRIGVSPDLADALALTFYTPDEPVGLAAIVAGQTAAGHAATEFDPYRDEVH